MLQYKQIGIWPSRKALWIMMHIRNDVTLVDAAFDKVIVSFYYKNSIIVLVV